jgi:hypothetical protein
MNKTSKKNNNIKVTLSIDKDVYRDFQKYCDKNAIMLSKKVELWIKKELEANK